MMIATIGAAAFGIARLLFADTSIASTYENGAIAYYAAESGIEEAFLRYKYNMNAEVPYGSWTLGENKVFRTNINENSVIHGGGVGRIPSDYALDYDYGSGIHWVDAAKEQIYDLRMGYIGTSGGPFYGQDSNNNGRLMESNFQEDDSYGTGDYSFLMIPEDEALKIDLSGLDLSVAGSENNLEFGLKFTSTSVGEFNTVSNRCKALAEIKLTVQKTGITREYKGLMGITSAAFDTFNCETVIGIDKSKIFLANRYSDVTTESVIAGRDLYLEHYRLQELITTNGGVLPGASDKVSLSVKPLYYKAALALTIDKCDKDLLNCTDKTNVVPGPYSYITSTGHFGGTTRTLTANIDRQSGTLYDLYDYVLFKGN